MMMKKNWKIGFSIDTPEDAKQTEYASAASQPAAPVKSVVDIHFPARNMTLTYYNDRFDLHRGDIVYVDGKLEGLRGRVVDVTYHFKIKLSEYKKVIAVADTKVSGSFHLAGSHFVTFDRSAIPFEKVLLWFKAPEAEDEEYICGYDEQTFPLDRPQEMGISCSAAQRGEDYYHENRVVYLSLDGSRGRALVEGSKVYEIEFSYADGLISNLTCSCFCSGACKHSFAAMLQLRETLDFVLKHDAESFSESEYFAAIFKPAFMTLAVDQRESGTLTLG